MNVVQTIPPPAGDATIHLLQSIREQQPCTQATAECLLTFNGDHFGDWVMILDMPLENAVDSNPNVTPQETRKNFAVSEPGEGRWFAKLRVFARYLWIAPIIIAAPAFLVAAEFIPDMNRGSISDGFRKLNVFLAAMAPIISICWGLAFLLTACNDIRLIPKSRILAWLKVFALLIAIAITLALLDR